MGGSWSTSGGDYFPGRMPSSIGRLVAWSGGRMTGDRSVDWSVDLSVGLSAGRSVIEHLAGRKPSSERSHLLRFSAQANVPKVRV